MMVKEVKIKMATSLLDPRQNVFPFNGRAYAARNNGEVVVLRNTRPEKGFDIYTLGPQGEGGVGEVYNAVTHDGKGVVEAYVGSHADGIIQKDTLRRCPPLETFSIMVSMARNTSVGSCIIQLEELEELEGREVTFPNGGQD